MKRVPFSVEGIRKGYLFYQKWYIKGFGPQGRTSPYKTLLSAPVPGGSMCSLHVKDCTAVRQ